MDRATRGGKSPEKRHRTCGPSGARDVQPMLYLLFALRNKANRCVRVNAKSVSAHSVNSYSGAQREA